MVMQEQQSKEGKRHAQKVAFLAGVLRQTYAPVSFDELKMMGWSVRSLNEPGAKENLEKSASNTHSRFLRESSKEVLADFDGYVGAATDELRKNAILYGQGMKEFHDYMKNHRAVLDYIVNISEGKKVYLIPEEEIVFDTLRRLSNNVIVGQLGVSDEEMSDGIFLAITVDRAAREHAKLTGQNPHEYTTRLAAQEGKIISS